MKIDPASACPPFARLARTALADLTRPPAASPSPPPVEEAFAALPGWWVTAGYWDRDEVEAWFAGPEGLPAQPPTSSSPASNPCPRLTTHRGAEAPLIAKAQLTGAVHAGDREPVLFSIVRLCSQVGLGSDPNRIADRM